MCFYLNYLNLFLAGSVCWLDSPGITGDTLAKGTWNRVSILGCRQGAEVAENAGHHSDHPRWPLTHLDGPIKSCSRQVRFVGPGIMRGDRVGSLKADVEWQELGEGDSR